MIMPITGPRETHDSRRLTSERRAQPNLQKHKENIRVERVQTVCSAVDFEYLYRV